MTLEKYYAIRIGDPRYHQPYFMVQPGTMTPWLFTSRADAEANKPHQPSTKVVRVWLHDGKKHGR